MKTKTTLNIFVGLGALITAVSAAWWGLVYHFVSQQNGESMWSSVSCMYSLSAECNFLRAMAWLRGINAYEPMLFWIGISVLLVSLIVRKTMLNEARHQAIEP
ncbi:MAG: hypothetical protein V7754_19835 [Halioglobus sp.]